MRDEALRLARMATADGVEVVAVQGVAYVKLAHAVLALAADLEAAERELREERAVTDDSQVQRELKEEALAKLEAAERERDEQFSGRVQANRRARLAERERDELRKGTTMTWEQTWDRLRVAERELATAREALTFYGESSDTGLLNDRGARAREVLASLGERADA